MTAFVLHDRVLRPAGYWLLALLDALALGRSAFHGLTPRSALLPRD